MTQKFLRSRFFHQLWILIAISVLAGAAAQNPFTTDTAPTMIHQYFQAFEKKDLATISGMLADDVTLQDPFVGIVRGKEAVTEVYRNMFTESSFQIQIKREFQRNKNSYAVEFHLIVTDMQGNQAVIEGIDLIELRDEKISSLRAYLDMSQQNAGVDYV